MINPVSVIRLYNCPEMTLVYNAANGSSTINYILMWPFLCCYCPVGLDHQRRDHWRYCLSSTFQRAPNHQDKNTYRLESVVVNNFRIFLGQFLTAKSCVSHLTTAQKRHTGIAPATAVVVKRANKCGRCRVGPDRSV